MNEAALAQELREIIERLCQIAMTPGISPNVPFNIGIATAGLDRARGWLNQEVKDELSS